MKVKEFALGMVLTVAAVSAMACPAGTHLVGGTGPHHKGGECVKEGAAAAKSEVKSKAKEAKSKTKDVAAKAAEKTEDVSKKAKKAVKE